MLAIHNSNSGFHPRWRVYCQKNNIRFKTVDCFSDNLISELTGCTALLWHHSQNDPRALVAAKPILFALEHSGVKVFPDFKTNWHFDDKLGQKYLFEGLHLPHAGMYSFYNKNDALDWANQTDFPKVFKLRRGAGSFNVKLVKDLRTAQAIINRAFGAGFSNFDSLSSLREVGRKYRLKSVSGLEVAKSFARLFVKPEFAKIAGRESGYVLFQDFIPNNDHDIRVIVIAEKAFAIKRMVRENDFRASGSGFIRYEKENFDEKTLKLAFEITEKIGGECIAMDFVYQNGNPLLIEISYGFDTAGYEKCIGYWDSNLNWYPGTFDPYGWMVEIIMASLEKSN